MIAGGEKWRKIDRKFLTFEERLQLTDVRIAMTPPPKRGKSKERRAQTYD